VTLQEKYRKMHILNNSEKTDRAIKTQTAAIEGEILPGKDQKADMR